MSLFDLAPKETEQELFGRERELGELVRLARAHRWVVVLGPRMVGKTSLVKVARNRLDWPGAYVNLWGVRSIQGLVEGLVHALNESATLRARLARASRRIEGISVGPAGLAISAPRPPLKSAWTLLDLLSTAGRQCLIVLDEVQELSANSGALLRLLGNLFNSRTNLTFVFTGSLVGLTRTLLEPDSASPLYGRAPAALTLAPFDRTTSAAFLSRGAAEAGIELPPDWTNPVLDGPVDGTPGWLTLLGNHVSVGHASPTRALDETIREGKKWAETELALFLRAHDPRLYWPALRAISFGAGWAEVRRFIAASTGESVNDGKVLRVLRALEASYIVRRTEAGYELADPMIRAFVHEARRPPRPIARPHAFAARDLRAA